MVTTFFTATKSVRIRIIHIVSLPLSYFYSKTSNLKATEGFVVKATFSFTDLIGYIITFWTLSQLFKQLGFLQTGWRTLLSLIISWVIFSIILASIGKLAIG